MIEANPYRLEEAKWTPGNVYDIIPPNALSYTGFEYSEGSDNVDEDAARDSLLGGFIDFFSSLLGTAGQILGGALELGGAIFSGFVNGVINFVGGFAKAIGSIFGGPTESPYPPMFSPIKANLEASIQPFKDQIEDSQQKSEELLAEQLDIRGQIAEQVDITRAAVADAKAASERAGVAIGEAESALAAAEDARETLEEYNTALTEQIRVEFNAAVGRADTAVEKAETLAGELEDFKAKHQLEIDDAIGKAEQAVADLATLSPQVDEAISKSSAATAKVLELSPMVSQAGEDASAAVAKAGQTLEEYTAWAAAQKIRIDSAVSGAEKATSDLAALSPQVADAVDKSTAATNKVAALTPQVSEAVAQAGAASDKADQTLSEYTAWTKTQKTRIDTAVSKAEAATANVATLSPQVADAVAKSEAATDNVATLTPQVSNAVTQASVAVDTASQTLSEYTAWAKTQKTRIDSAVSKAETATANVTALTPQVADAVAKSAAATDSVSTLTPKVTDAVTKAGAAVTKADAVTSAYNTFKTEQQARIDTAVSKAEKATSDVSTLTPKVTDAVSKSNKAAADVSTLTPKVDDAAAKAAKASTDVSALTPKVTAAQDKANKAANDLSTLTPKVTAAQTRADAAYTEAGKVRTEVTPKIEAAQTKGESALAVADKAVDWLRNPNEIGASLIAIDPETKKPNWAEHLDPVTAEENPLNLPNAYKTGDNYSRNPRRMTVNVDPSTEYMVSLWVKADKPGSQMTYDIRNQDGELAFDARRKVDGFLDAGDNWRAYWIKSVPTEWTQYKKIVTPRETTRTAEFGISYFKHSSGSTQDVIQYIADFQIYPLVPSQLDVDQAQNDAIRANAEILRQQDEINEAQRVANLAQDNFNDNQLKWNTASDNATQALADADQAQKDINAEQTKFNNFHTEFVKDQTKWNAAVDRSIATQNTVNDNFNKWTDGAAKAIEANTTAIKALTKPEIGSSLIALDADTREPYYLQWAGTPATPSTAGLPFTKAVRVTSSTQDRRDAPAGMRVPVKVNPDITYKWSMWVYSNKIGTEIAFLTTSDSIGLCVEETTYKQDDRVFNSKWGIFLKDIPMGWSKQEGTIKFLPGTDNVHLYSVEWNKTNVASAQQWFAAFDIVPDVPTQVQVDDAQNKAIESLNILSAKQDDWNEGTTAALEAQKKVNDNFNKWSDGATTAIAANTTAIKALSKIDIGESLIAYLTPSDAQVKAGTAKYDVPAWSTGAHKEMQPSSFTNPPPAFVKNIFGASSTDGTKPARSVPATVRPGTKYILSFWAYGSGDLVVYMLGNGAGYPIRSTRQLMVDQDTLEILKDAEGRRRYNPANNGNSSSANGTQWLLNGFKPDQLYKWTHYKFEVEFTDSTTEVRFQNFYWNWKTPSTYGQFLGDMQFYPDVPTQASVDAAQNKAIETFDLFMGKQDEWNKGTTAALATQATVDENFKKWSDGAAEAITANTNAIKALNAPQTGSSILPMVPGTATPTWLDSLQRIVSGSNAADRVLPESVSEYYRWKGGVISGNSTETVNIPHENVVTVDPNMEYEASWYIRCSTGKPNFAYITFESPETGADCVEKTDDAEASANTWGNTIRPLITPVTTTWTKQTSRFKFKPGTRSIRLTDVHFNNSGSSVSAYVYIADLQVAPKIPTQQKVDDAQNKAIESLNILAAKQEEWNDGTAAALDAQDKVDKNFQKWTDGAAKAITANTNALALLTAPQGASSLIPINPLTKEPNYLGWAGERISVANIDSVPTRAAVKHTGTVQKRFYAPSDQLVPVKVARGQVYRWTAWTYANVADSSILIYFRDPATGTGTASTTHDKESKTHGHSSYGLFLRGIPSGWNKISGTMTFKDEISAIEMYSIGWNYYGSSSSLTQYITGFDIAPDVPTQAQVDATQFKALEAHDLLFKKQDDWNDGTTAALLAQKTVDDNFKKWSDGAAEAIEANKNAIKALNAPQTGHSVIPLMPGTTTPAWTVNADATGTSSSLVTGREDPVWYRFDRTRVPGSDNMVAVDSSLEYDFSVWIHGTTDSRLYVAMVDQDGKTAIQSGAIRSYTQNNGSTYLIENMAITSGWKKVSTTITLRPGVKFVRVSSIYGNHSNGVAGSAYLSDMRMAPKIPTQASVDKAQNDAIGANTEALKALGKKVLGASLVPYKTPSTKEVEDYAAGKLSYDPWADPEYINAGHKIANSSKGRTAEAGVGQETVQFEGSYVTVDSNIWYKVKFKTWASTAGSRLVVYMYNQNNDLALAETPFADGGRTSGGLVHYITLPNGWKEWEGVVKFSQATTSVRLGTFFWNHPTGTTTARQFFMDLEIVPNIPDANVVNELQDNAIRKNTAIGAENKKAIDALTEGMEAYVAAADLEALHKDIQDELEKEQDARAELAAEINNYMVESIPRTIIYGSGPQFNDHISAERYKVVAKPGWVGQMLLDVTYVSKSDGTQTKRVIQNYNVPDTDGSREYDVPNASFGGYQPSYRLDYWVYRGRSIQKALSSSGSYITGSSFTKNSWTRIATHSIKKSNGAVHILWRTRLTRADRGVTYSFDVRVNGKSVLDKHYKGYGPLTSFGDGGATLSFSGNLSVPDNGKIEIYAKASGTSTQASVSSNKGTLSYLELE